MTYDANGFRPLNATTETVSLVGFNTLASVATGSNVRATTGSVQPIAAGGQTINSLSTSNNRLDLYGSATTDAAGDVLTITSGGVAASGGVALPNIQLTNATLDFPNGANFLLGSAVYVTGNSRLTGTGGVTVAAVSPSGLVRFTNTPSGGNSFTGGLYVQGSAQVMFTANNQLGNDVGGLAAGAITLGGGQLIYYPASAATVSLADGLVARDIRVNASNGTISSAIADAVLQIPGTISGVGQVLFGSGLSATGVVELTNPGANTYTGGTVVGRGILRIGRGNQLGTGPVLLDGGTLQASAPLTIATNLTLTASSTLDTQTFAVTLAGGLNGSGGDTGTSVFGVTKTGTGTLTIAGDGNFAGLLTVAAGTLAVPSIAASGNQPLGNSTASLVVGSATTGGTLEYTGATAATLARTITVGGTVGATVRNSGTGVLTLTATTAVSGGANPVAFDALGTIVVSRAITGTGTLTKAGTGALFLDGATATPISLAAGTLGGTGTLAENLVVTAGTLAPGGRTAIGTLTTTNNTATAVSLVAGATLSYSISHANTGTAPVAGTNNDVLNAAGASAKLVLPAGTVNVLLDGTAGTTTPYTLYTPVTYTLATFAGGVTDGGAAFAVDATNFAPAGEAAVTGYQYSVATSGNNLVLTVQPVPEPASVLAIAAATAGAVGVWRRRRSAVALAESGV